MPTVTRIPMAVARRIKWAIFGKPPPGREWAYSNLGDFRLDPEDRHELAPQYTGELSKVFFGPKERLVDKWLHYLPIYERYFDAYRGRDLNFLEIGVFKGGSLEMWRKYFGDKARICGVDINPDCAAYETPGTKVRIGSQDDPAFLNSVIAEIGAPDIILDDGSHISAHQEVSFKVLFPHLKEGGLYVIEDVHTAYWGDWDGGHKMPGTAIELVKQMIDDMHAWYHKEPTTTPAKTDIGGIHVYDSMVFIEKRKRPTPAAICVPGAIPA